MNLEPEKAELQRIPTTTKEVELSTARSVMAMIDFFEDDDDVQAVYHNMELTDEIAEALSE